MLSCLCGKHLATNICYFDTIHGPLLSLPFTGSHHHLLPFGSFGPSQYTDTLSFFFFFLFKKKKKKGKRKRKAPLPLYPLSRVQPHHPSSCFFCSDMITGKLSDTWENANPEQLEICYYFGKIKTKPFEMYRYIGL